MTKLILDVGSGPYPLKGENVVHVDIDRQWPHVEVVCDIHHLPFRDEAFSVVHASHVVEHLKNPVEALKQFRRVSKKTVIVKVPNAVYDNYYHNDVRTDFDYPHLFSWGPVIFKQFLETVFSKVKVDVVLHCRRGSTNKVRHQIAVVRFYILSLFWKTNELVGVCEN